MKFERLITQARATAKLRGHELKRGANIGNPYRPVWTATCKNCLAAVHVRLHPLPNETDISGEAVAINCEPIEGQPHA